MNVSEEDSPAYTSRGTLIASALRLSGEVRNINRWMMLAAGYQDPITENVGCFKKGTMCLLYPDDASCKTKGFTANFWLNIPKVAF